MHRTSLIKLILVVLLSLVAISTCSLSVNAGGNTRFQLRGTKLAVPELTTTPESTSCGASFCYKLFTSFLSWQDARNTCRVTGGDLASVETSNVNRFIEKTFGKQSNAFWIGLRKNEDNKLLWSDGQKYRYSMLEVSDPTVSERMMYAQFSGNSGRWKVQPGRFKRQYLCKYAQE